jgi:general L-amino acid transport system permease protein
VGAGVSNYGSRRIATGGADVGAGAENTAAAEAGAEGESVNSGHGSSLYDWLLILAVLGASISGVRAIRRWATAKQEATGLRPTTWWIQLGLLFGPLLIVLIGLGAHLERPELSGFNFVSGTHLRNSLIALWLALSLYTGAFIAEIVRGGILAVSRGQTEAAYSLGLRPRRTMSLVILPQAMRVIIPPLISQYLNLTKNSSLAIAVGYMDVRSTLGGITINQTGRELEGMLLLGAFYLVASLIISGVMNAYNASVKLKER